ncbi:MAG: SDR family NAD(P)-dependent oxidoreductase [Hyphomicrobiales bacterium]
MNELNGKHAVVTGGGTGVGAEIASALANAGAAVTITGRRAAPLEEIANAHSGIHAAMCDVTSEQAVSGLFDQIGKKRGIPNIIIANAGAAESAPLTKSSLDLWNAMLEVNLTGVFLTFREAMKRLERDDWGRMIAIASTAGLKGYAYTSAYCAAKHGVIGLVRALASENAKSNVTFNAVCPGFTDTPMLDAAIHNIIEKTGMSKEEARKALASTNPQGRFVQPKEVAASVMWLVGNGGDAVNGQAISISGGETS